MLPLRVLNHRLAVCRLDHTAAVPRWAMAGPFWSVTRTSDELSIVCADDWVPEGVSCVRGWRAIRVVGQLDLAATGILAGLTDPLAAARISVFAVATYDTDYLLVPGADLDRAIAILRDRGNEIAAEENIAERP